jgi:hypothetical protein
MSLCLLTPLHRKDVCVTLCFDDRWFNFDRKATTKKVEHSANANNNRLTFFGKSAPK